MSITEDDKDPVSLPPGAPPLPFDVPPPVPAPQVNATDRLRKQIYIGFGGSIAVGLAIAGLYIGGRVFASDGTKSATKVVPAVSRPSIPVQQHQAEKKEPAPLVVPTAKPAAAVAPKVVEPVQVAKAVPPPGIPAVSAVVEKRSPAKPVVTAVVAPKPELALTAPFAVIAPHTRARYLQLAALGRKPTVKFLQELHEKGIVPVVAPGPSEDLYRVLLGPFPDKDAMQKQKTILDTDGYQSFVRIYDE